MSLSAALEQAWAARNPLRDEGVTAYRLMDGRCEGAPGWTVDRYGPALLVQSFERTGAPPQELEELEAVLESLCPGVPIVLKERGLRGPREDQEGRILGGVLPVSPVADPLAAREGRLVVDEGGLSFGVDLLYGQNTGLFLDARPVRAWLRENSRGRRVLNLFSYTSSLGVAAAVGGARSVTNVDMVRSALDRGRANYALNGLEADPRSHMRSEVFEFLRRARSRDELWDGVVVDPPPVPTQGARRDRRKKRGFDPARDLARLVKHCLDRVAPGGWLLALSAVRGRERFEGVLPEGDWEELSRGRDFPGAPAEGLRAQLLRT